MHKICIEILSGFCRKLGRISESVRTTCCGEINDSDLHSFPIFRSQAESDKGHEGAGVAEDVGGKEVKG